MTGVRCPTAVLLQMVSVLFLAYTSCIANPLPPPLQLYTTDELRVALAASSSFQRTPAVSQLAALGPAHIDIIEEGLASAYEDVQLAGVRALWRIGDDRSLSALRAVFRNPDSSHPTPVRIAAAEALAELRDTDALSMLEDAVTATSDSLVAKQVASAVCRLRRSTFDEPVLSSAGRGVLFHCLLEDIREVRLTDRQGRIVFTLDPSQWRRLSELLQQSEPLVAGTWGPKARLHILLQDGRSAFLTTDWGPTGRFDYTESHGRVLDWHGFSVRNVALAAWLREIVPGDALPALLQGSMEKQWSGTHPPIRKT